VVGDKHWRCRGSLKRDGQRDPFANVHDKSRPEAGNAVAVCLLSHTRINNTRGSLLKEELSQSLRAGIRVRRQAFAKFRTIPNVVELCPEISEVLDIVEDLRMRPVDFLQLFASMKGHFCLGGFQSKGGVPRSPLRAIEPAACRMRIGECGIDDVSVRNAKHQLMDGDAWQQTRLAEYTTICRAIELRELLQFALLVNQSRQGALLFECVLAGDQSMCVILP